MRGGGAGFPEDFFFLLQDLSWGVSSLCAALSSSKRSQKVLLDGRGGYTELGAGPSLSRPMKAVIPGHPRVAMRSPSALHDLPPRKAPVGQQGLAKKPCSDA